MRASSGQSTLYTDGLMNAVHVKGLNQTEHLENIVRSVSDATKRLSQISNASTTNTNTCKRKSRDTVGPWKLGKTLGKGSSGRVRLAKHMETGDLAAIKIVSKKNVRLQQVGVKGGVVLPYGIEREIIIMKLITHPNIMALYEVWENKSELYLVLEYVEGGELFDYLISRGKLNEGEAVHYFRQVLMGVSYFHHFNICHRDLKPENLLLDKKNHTVKIADFGMAALETNDRLLETSCGSPHYASPEIVMGQRYHGTSSDLWSCGIVLFALLTGQLPFNDDNVKRLLMKVKSGKYHVPQFLSEEAKDLISRLLVVSPEKRISIHEIMKHPLLTKYDTDGNSMSGFGSDLRMLSNTPNIVVLNSLEEIDEDILGNLRVLWRGASREYLIEKLLKKELTQEKLFYSLLWNYQKRSDLLKTANKPLITPTMICAPDPAAPSVNITAAKGVRKSLISSDSSVKSSKGPKAEHVPLHSKVFHCSSLKRSLPSIYISNFNTFHKQSKSGVENSDAQVSNVLLHSSSFKKSLYSLEFISKNSLNLNAYLKSPPNFSISQLTTMDTKENWKTEPVDIGENNHGSKIKDYSTNYEEGQTTSVLLNENNSSLIPDLPVESTFKFEVGTNQNNDRFSTSLSITDKDNCDSKDESRDYGFYTPMTGRSSKKDGLEINISFSSSFNAKPSGNRDSEQQWNNFTISDSNSESWFLSSLDPHRKALKPSKEVEDLLKRYKKRNSNNFVVSANYNSFVKGKKQKNENNFQDVCSTYHSNKQESVKEHLVSIDVPSEGKSSLNTKNKTGGFLSNNSILEQYDTIHSSSNCTNSGSKNCANNESKLNSGILRLPSSFLNSTNTFQNLNNFINNLGEVSLTFASPAKEVKLSETSKPIEGNVGTIDQDHHFEYLNKDLTSVSTFSDMSLVADLPAYTCTAKAVSISSVIGSNLKNLNLLGHERFGNKFERQIPKHLSYTRHIPSRQTSEDTEPLGTAQESESVNIFEDAYADEESLATTNDSEANVHRKAVSIDTINTCILPLNADMSTSVYAGNNTLSIPRETTEEMLYEFQLPSENMVVQDVSTSRNATRLSNTMEFSKSLLSMFKDLDEELSLVRNSQKSGSKSGFSSDELNNEGQKPTTRDTEHDAKINAKGCEISNSITMLFNNCSEKVSKCPPLQYQGVRTQDSKQNSIKLDAILESPVEQLATDLKKIFVNKINRRPPTKKTVGLRKNRHVGWFSALIQPFSKLKKDSDTLVFLAYLAFEDVNILVLRWLGVNHINYCQKRMERKQSKQKALFDCSFNHNSTKIRLSIHGIDGEPTELVVTSRNKSTKSSTFIEFNAGITDFLSHNQHSPRRRVI